VAVFVPELVVCKPTEYLGIQKAGPRGIRVFVVSGEWMIEFVLSRDSSTCKLGNMSTRPSARSWTAHGRFNIW